MTKMKRIGALLLTGLMIVCTACVFPVNLDKGGSNQNAQITGSDDPVDTPNVDPEPEPEPDVNEDEFALPSMNSKKHAYYDGKIYYRQYAKKDYADDIVLYFADPSSGLNYSSETKKIVCLNPDGTLETITEEDKGFGDLYVIDGILFSQYYLPDWSEGDMITTCVYQLDLTSKERYDIDGYSRILGRVGDLLVMQKNDYYENDEYRNGEICLVNPMDGTVFSSMTGSAQFIGTDDNAMYGVQTKADYSKDVVEYTLSFYRCTKDGKSETIGELDNTYFADWGYLSYPEITCFQVVDNDVIFDVGYYEGTGHFFARGLIFDIQLDKNNTLKKIADVDADTFYCTKGDNGICVNYRSYNTDSENTDTYCVPVDGASEVKATDYIGQKYQTPYVHYDKTSSNGSGDVSIYADLSGKLTTLIKKSDYEAFGYGFGMEEGKDYEVAGTTEVYDIEYAGNKLFFSVAEMERTPEHDIGWRYSYKVKKFANFVKDLKTGEVKLLYEE